MEVGFVAWVLRQSEHGLQKNFQAESISEKSEFIKNRERRACGH